LRSWIVFAADQDTPTEFRTATGVGGNTEDRVPVVLARRKAAGTTYAWAVSTRDAASAPTVTAVPVASADGAVLPAHQAAAARIRHGGNEYLVIANPGGSRITVGDWTGSEKLMVVQHRKG
jgi:hypothetical protein